MVHQCKNLGTTQLQIVLTTERRHPNIKVANLESEGVKSQINTSPEVLERKLRKPRRKVGSIHGYYQGSVLIYLTRK